MSAASDHPELLSIARDLCAENGARLVYLTIFGSTLYGTEITGKSDLDVRGLSSRRRNLWSSGQRSTACTFPVRTAPGATVRETGMSIFFPSSAGCSNCCRRGKSARWICFFRHPLPGACSFPHPVWPRCLPNRSGSSIPGREKPVLPTASDRQKNTASAGHGSVRCALLLAGPWNSAPKGRRQGGWQKSCLICQGPVQTADSASS